MLDDSDLDLPSEQAPAPPPRSGNRSFLLVAGILGTIMLLALVALAVYALVILPQQQRSAEPTQSATPQLTATELAHALQATSTPTRTPTRTPTSTRTPQPPTATNTPVTPIFTETTGPTTEPGGATQTVDALLTQAALAQTSVSTAGPETATPQGETPTATASALPQTGLADDLGGPGLMAAASLLLLLIIIAARRLRSAE